MNEQALLAAGEIYSRFVSHISDRGSLNDTIRVLVLRLAQGTPIGLEEAARLLQCQESDIEHHLANLPLRVERDEDDRIVGAGLTLRPTRHEFTVDGKRLYTWCALDALLFPIWLGRTAQISSHCVSTGRKVLLTVNPDSLDAVEPAEAAISIVAPDKASADIRQSFCVHVNFFASSQAAHAWADEQQGVAVLTMEDAFTLAKQLARSPVQKACSC